MMTSFDDNEDKVCLLFKDNVGESCVRSHARSRIGLHNHKSRDQGVTSIYNFT